MGGNKMKFITIFQYCKKYPSVQRQKVYRQIREHKLKRNVDYKLQERLVKRLYVREDLII